jgi:hypothetical protein
MTQIAYLTDVEGIWHKLLTFVTQNPLVSLDAQERLQVKPNALFVFGGDAIDRGPDSRRIVQLFTEAKLRQPEQVILLAGNRDINKMRLQRELAGSPPKRAPEELAAGPRPELLRWIFSNTMGARDAFINRQEELARQRPTISEEEVVQSFLSDLQRDGALSQYLSLCQLAYRHQETLFVHGGVTAENLGVVPFVTSPFLLVDEWVARLNLWYQEQIDAYLEQRFTPEGEPAWQPLIAYQAPLPGTRVNQSSVVYSRLADEWGNPYLMSKSVRERLAQNQIKRVVLGHTPSGDSPSLLRAQGLELIMADNSYGRVNFGSRLLLDHEQTQITALAKLDSHEEVSLSLTTELSRATDPIGYRIKNSGHLVKGLLQDGSYLLFKAFNGYRVEQIRMSATKLAQQDLEEPDPS